MKTIVFAGGGVLLEQPDDHPLQVGEIARLDHIPTPEEMVNLTAPDTALNPPPAEPNE